jgi:carbamoyltransferase
LQPRRNRFKKTIARQTSELAPPGIPGATALHFSIEDAIEMTAILGISAFYHDSAAALIVDGDVVAAAQEERFTRKKHDSEFPIHAIEYCLRAGNLAPGELDYVGFYDKPLVKFERLLETYLAYVPSGLKSYLSAMPVWLNQKLHLAREMSKGLKGQYKNSYVFVEHHESHAASAFFPSPFDEAAILTLDGVGEWATAACGYGRGNQIALTREMKFPHSPGLLYSAFTYYCGFTVNSGEYKLMGLAPYGEPLYVDLILDKLIDLKDDGSFRMDMSYFNYCQGLTMTSAKFHRLFGGPPRQPDTRLTQRDMDIAASIQKVIEEIVLRMARSVHVETNMRNLCMAGGVALNCVANGRVLREGPFENVWIQPAAGDAGGAVGVALFIWHQLMGKPRAPAPEDSQHGSLLGPAYGDEAIGAFLDGVGATYQRVGDDRALCERVSQAIADGQVVGWFQGPMEFGPRALGGRSILGDARNPDMQRVMNTKVKFREGFRPFAPIVLREHVDEYFQMRPNEDSPYMLLVAPVREEKRRPIPAELAGAKGIDKLKQNRSILPAITHVDYSARVQTVDSQRHGLLHQLMQAFYAKTGCPVMINTSFNLGWDPIVCTPQDAYETFMSCDIDMLVMGHHVLTKPAQPAHVPVAGEGEGADFLESLLVSPVHGDELAFDDRSARCPQSGHAFQKTDGIWQMFWPHEKIDDPRDVTHRVKEFYEETPFPNYDDHDSVRSLLEKARRGGYARALDRAIPYNATVLEVGCGTGQLSNFLGISCRRVVGSDVCLNSLRLGEEFRSAHGLNRVRFVQMNLFRPCFRREQFDVILCNGVLHHTADPYGGFRSILPLLKPGGYIVVGLYNRYGRIMTDLRRGFFNLTRGRAKWVDPILRHYKKSEGQIAAWFQDQYRHPHESKHTIDEVLAWFDEQGLQFVRGVPSVSPVPRLAADAGIFDEEPRGTRIEHLLAQIRQIVTGNREGGFYLMVGRKPLPAARPAVDGQNLVAGRSEDQAIGAAFP